MKLNVIEIHTLRCFFWNYYLYLSRIRMSNVFHVSRTVQLILNCEMCFMICKCINPFVWAVVLRLFNGQCGILPPLPFSSYTTVLCWSASVVLVRHLFYFGPLLCQMNNFQINGNLHNALIWRRIFLMVFTLLQCTHMWLAQIINPTWMDQN